MDQILQALTDSRQNKTKTKTGLECDESLEWISGNLRGNGMPGKYSTSISTGWRI